jgi:ABC-type branched-subunit amino acid transport system ATPase component
MSAILQLQGISKRYGAVVASDNLSLHLDPEEALGVIGPNGSGKTTMFNIITGIAVADRGQIFLAEPKSRVYGPSSVAGEVLRARFRFHTLLVGCRSWRIS